MTVPLVGRSRARRVPELLRNLLYLQGFRPLSIAVEPNIAHAGNSDFDEGFILTQPILVELQLYAKSKVVTLFGSFDRLGRELCAGRNKGHLCSYGIFRGGIKYDSTFRSERHLSCDRLG